MHGESPPPVSPFVAGLISRHGNNLGYWWYSPIRAHDSSAISPAHAPDETGLCGSGGHPTSGTLYMYDGTTGARRSIAARTRRRTSLAHVIGGDRMCQSLAQWMRDEVPFSQILTEGNSGATPAAFGDTNTPAFGTRIRSLTEHVYAACRSS